LDTAGDRRIISGAMRVEEVSPRPADSARPPEIEARPERTCPNCGSTLAEQKCKLLCPNRECGYYMSCSDFY